MQSADIAGILSHMIDGKERPVFFVSRRLYKAEKNYPIVHRESLGIVFALEKFYKYVLGVTTESHCSYRSKAIGRSI